MRLFKRNYDSLEVIDVCNVLVFFLIYCGYV